VSELRELVGGFDLGFFSFFLGLVLVLGLSLLVLAECGCG
jgi:hypothetical protein